MTPVDLGSHLLLFTRIRWWRRPISAIRPGCSMHSISSTTRSARARQILAARGVTLVVVCPQMPEMRGQSDASPDSFVKLFAEGHCPIG